MSHGIIGGILGVAIAFVLDFIGVDTYVIEFLQPYLTFALNIYHFYGLFGILGAVAGILPW
jgi:hypothetical protein